MSSNDSLQFSRNRSLWGLPCAFWGLWMAQFINRIASFAQPFLVLYLTRDHGVSIGAASVVTGGVGVGSIFAAIVGGWAADRWGRRNTMLAGQTITACALVWLALGSGFSQMFISAIMVGFGSDMVRPAMSAAVSDMITPDLHVRAYGLLFWSLNLGFSFATISGGLLARFGFSQLFLINAAASVLSAFFILKSTNERRLSNPNKTFSFISHLIRDRGTVRLVWVGIIYAIVYFQAYSTLPIVMTSQNISPTVYGLIISLNGIVICLVQPAAVRFIEKRDPYNVYEFGMIVFGTGFAITMFASDPLLHGLAVTLWTLGEVAVAGVVGAIFAARSPENLRGRYQSLVSFCLAVGAAVGPPLGGYILSWKGSTFVWIFCGFSGLLGAVLLHGLRASDSSHRRNL